MFNLGIGGFDCRKRRGQRLEIAGVLEPTIPHPLERSAQPPELGLVDFGNAVDAVISTLAVLDARDSSRVTSTR